MYTNKTYRRSLSIARGLARWTDAHPRVTNALLALQGAATVIYLLIK